MEGWGKWKENARERQGEKIERIGKDRREGR